MERVLIGYTILNLAIMALVLICVRASRLRATPDERQDLEENALTATDWELVQCERCLPSACARLRGQPPRPRKDVTCEVCAATFLELRLQRLLSPPGTGAADPVRTLPVLTGPQRAPSPSAVEAAPDPTRILAHDPARRPGHSRRSTSRTDRWGRVRFGMGVACVAAGALAALLGGPAGMVFSGYLVVGIGLALMVSGIVSGTV
jgi:hypothetical protein